MGFLPFEENKSMRASTKPSLSKIAHSSRAALISGCRELLPAEVSPS
jgi:hypothetical protein